MSLRIATLTAVALLAACQRTNNADPRENAAHDPCYWLAVYSDPRTGRAQVEDDSAGTVLTPPLQSAAAEGAKDSICATRKR